MVFWCGGGGQMCEKMWKGDLVVVYTVSVIFGFQWLRLCWLVGGRNSREILVVRRCARGVVEVCRVRVVVVLCGEAGEYVHSLSGV